MIQYIYFVKCPNCEDEPFDFFDEAKGYAMGCLTQKPIITQTEVCRNDFGECTDSADLGTVWSWEDVMGKETEAEPTVSVFTKDDFANFENDYNPDNDPEFANLDDSLDEETHARFAKPEGDRIKAFNNALKYAKKDNKPYIYGYANHTGKFFALEQPIKIADNDGFKAEQAFKSKYKNCKLIYTAYPDKPFVEESFDKDTYRKPIPEGMTIEQLVETMEENEAQVECAGCEELFNKEDCIHDDRGWLCDNCADSVVKCTWCDELYDKSECRYEVDLGWLCSRCEMAIKSRGETLTFREGSYWDDLDESVEDTRTLADIVKDSINHLTNDLGKDPWADDFADDVITDLENNYGLETPEDMPKYSDWVSSVACEVSRQVNKTDMLEETTITEEDSEEDYFNAF